MSYNFNYNKKRKRHPSESPPQEDSTSTTTMGGAENRYRGNRSRSPRDRRDSRDGPSAFHFTSDRVGAPRPRGSRSASRSRDRDRDRERSPRARNLDLKRIPSLDVRAKNYHPNQSSSPQRSSAQTSVIGSPRLDHNSLPKKDLNPASERSPQKVVDQDAIAKELAELFVQISNEQVDQAVLRIEKTAAEKEFGRRDKDYKSSKAIHEKHPSHEESQKKARAIAEKKLKDINEKVESKDAVLKELASQSATRLIPAIINSGTSDSERRIKELENTCAQLKEQLESQKTYVEGQRQARLTLERKHEAVTGESQSKLKTLTEKVTGLSKTVSGLPKPENLKQNLDKLEKQFERVDHLSHRIDEQNHVITKTDKRISAKVDTHIKDVAEFKETVETSNKSKEDYSKRIEACHEKILAIDAIVRGGFVADSTRFSAGGLTGTVSQISKDMASFQADLKKLQESSSALNGFPAKPSSKGSSPVPVSNETILKSLESRLQAAEIKIQDLPSQDERVVMSSDLDDINNELKGVKRDQENTNKLLDDYAKSLNKVQATFDSTQKDIRDTRGLQGSSVDSLEDLQNSLNNTQKELNKTSKKFDPLLGRVTALEKDAKEISEKNLSGLRSNVSDLQIGLSALKGLNISSKLMRIENRVGVLERQPGFKEASNKEVLTTSDTSEALTSKALASEALASASNFSSDFAALKSSIMSDVENQQHAVDEVFGDLIEKLQVELKDLSSRFTVLEGKAPSDKATSDTGPNLELLVATVESLQTLQNATQAGISKLETDLNDIRKLLPETSISATLSKLQSDLNTVRESIPGTASNTLMALLSQPQHLPLDGVTNNVIMNVNQQLDQKLSNFAKSAGDINQNMTSRMETNHSNLINEVEAVKFNINALDKRMLNINTKDMALFILSQMGSTYPNLQEAQNALSDWKKEMVTVKAQIDTLALSIDELKNRESGPVDTSSIQSQIDELAKTLSAVESTTQAAKDSAAALRKEYDQYQLDMATELASDKLDIEECQKALKSLQTSQPRQSATPDFGPLTSNLSMAAPRSSSRVSTAASPTRSLNGINRTPQPPPRSGILAPSQRSSSILSDQSAKKRKLNGTTGLGINGTRTSPPASAKKRHKAVDGDNSDDEDFVPTQRIPHHSDDEE